MKVVNPRHISQDAAAARAVASRLSDVLAGFDSDIAEVEVRDIIVSAGLEGQVSEADAAALLAGFHGVEVVPEPEPEPAA